MDIKNVIVTAAQEVIQGVEEAKKALAGKAVVDFPTRIELEFGITSSYELANYDDVRIATVTVAIPLFKADNKPAEQVTELTGAVAPETKKGNKKK